MLERFGEVGIVGETNGFGLDILSSRHREHVSQKLSFSKHPFRLVSLGSILRSSLRKFVIQSDISSQPLICHQEYCLS